MRPRQGLTGTVARESCAIPPGTGTSAGRSASVPATTSRRFVGRAARSTAAAACERKLARQKREAKWLRYPSQRDACQCEACGGQGDTSGVSPAARPRPEGRCLRHDRPRARTQARSRSRRPRRDPLPSWALVGRSVGMSTQPSAGSPSPSKALPIRQSPSRSIPW